MVLVVLVVPLVFRGSLVLVVLLVLVVGYPVVFPLVGYPVVLAARSPSIGTACGNLGVRDGMREKASGCSGTSVTQRITNVGSGHNPYSFFDSLQRLDKL